MFRISCVKYINSLPFIYGIQNSEVKSQIDLSLDIPSASFRKLIDDEADIGLVPVVAMKKLKEKHIISSYCIGARGIVNSVLLISPSPLEKINTIYLDYQSRTSVELVKVLCREYWKINPEFRETTPGYVKNSIAERTGIVVIGDRAFPFLDKRYKVYDLAGEWMNFSGKPFVFACWIANKKIDPGFIKALESALAEGLGMRENIISDLKKEYSDIPIDLHEYFYKNINYNFDPESREGMELFLNLLH